MTAAQNDSGRSARSGLHLWVALLLALLLLVSWFMGYGPGGSKCAAAAQASAGPAAGVQSSAPPAAPPAPATPVPPTVSALAVSAPAPTAPAVAAPAAMPVPSASAATEPAAATPAPKPEPAPGAAAVASVVPVAKVYFAVEKAKLPKSASRDLARVVRYLKANPRARALVSGFHDPSGNQVNNESLALRRAQVVSTAMQKMGIAKQRIVLQKPEQTVGSGKSEEARRVEVAVARS